MTGIPARLRALLVCPRCHGALADEDAALRCDACRLRYAVRDGIPVLLVDEAQPLDTVQR